MPAHEKRVSRRDKLLRNCIRFAVLFSLIAWIVLVLTVVAYAGALVDLLRFLADLAQQNELT
jgi:cell division protein FtsB